MNDDYDEYLDVFDRIYRIYALPSGIHLQGSKLWLNIPELNIYYIDTCYEYK